MPDEDEYWQYSEAHTFTDEEWEQMIPLGMIERDYPPPPPMARGPFEHLDVPWRWERPRLVCTCVWHFGPGMDMVRTANPDCPWIEHRRLAQKREEGP
jgi:hypothetical protein